MTQPIEIHTVGPTQINQVQDPLLGRRLLPGAIRGVETHFYVQGGGGRHSPNRDAGRAQVFLFVNGVGKIQVHDRSLSFSEVAAFFAPGDVPILIQAGSGPLEYLEILIALHGDEVARTQRGAALFVLYSQCEAYSETIKSPKTISRTIVPPNTIPRFCMGSVEALGPDEVAPHSHPMLEQLFFGLPGNACVVTADDEETAFGERTLLHIPLGSRHGVRVDEGRTMHYVWMDFFEREADQAWIREQHKPIRK
jgi:mannose-6-phosphate isomerase-like protein (cupin superfamily)